MDIQTPPRRDAGQSLISSVAMIAVFLGFLFLAVHICVNLYATSTVTSHAYDAARNVARADIDHSDPNAVAGAAESAEADLREALGRYGERIQLIDWDLRQADDVIVMRIVVDNPSFLVFSGLLGGNDLGVGSVDRTVRVRVERVR